MYRPPRSALVFRGRLLPRPSLAAARACLNRAGYDRDEAGAAVNPRATVIEDSGCYLKTPADHPPVDCHLTATYEPSNCQYRVFVFEGPGGEIEVYGRYESQEPAPVVARGVADPALTRWLEGAKA